MKKMHSLFIFVLGMFLIVGNFFVEVYATTSESEHLNIIQKTATIVKWELQYNADDVYGIITGENQSGEICWQMQTGIYEQVGDYSMIHEIGQNEGKYYYFESGNIIALNVEDGKQIWSTKTDTYGISVSTFDENGILYISGFYGPALMGIDPDGNIITVIDKFASYYWPTEIICQDGEAKVTLCAGSNGLDSNSDYVATSTSDHNNKVTYVVNLSDNTYTPVYYPDLGDAQEGRAYRDFMSKGGYDPEFLYFSNTRYLVYDINGDEKLELILWEEKEWEQLVYLYQYDGKKVIEIELQDEWRNKIKDLIKTNYTNFQPLNHLVDINKKTAAVTVSFEMNPGTFDGSSDILDEQFAIIRGISKEGKTVWGYKSEKFQSAQIQPVYEIGIYGEKYYLNEGGTIIAFNLADGKELWRCEDCGIGDVAFGNGGMLYLCGFTGPDFTAINSEGKIVHQIYTIDSNYGGAYGIKVLEDKVAISYEISSSGVETGAVFYVDLKDYSVQKAS